MGSPVSEPDRSDNEAPHQVTVGGFYMGKYEVTKAEYEAVMETNPNPGNFNRANLPVEQVSWFDAIDYCNRLSRREGLTEAYTVSGNGDSRTVTWNRQANGYRLPTEAEWEYACRAGTTTSFNTGNTITTDQANYNGNAAETYREQTTPVGSFAPNAWGLYDMHGNVWEWCWDRYGDYPGEARNNPEGASSGRSRVFRGGSWSRAAQFVRSAGREYDSPSYRDSTLGFRLARTL
jgi:formylglycine-generating enzyme required for sulfatase activity